MSAIRSGRSSSLQATVRSSMASPGPCPAWTSETCRIVTPSSAGGSAARRISVTRRRRQRASIEPHSMLPAALIASARASLERAVTRYGRSRSGAPHAPCACARGDRPGTPRARRRASTGRSRHGVRGPTPRGRAQRTRTRRRTARVSGLPSAEAYALGPSARPPIRQRPGRSPRARRRHGGLSARARRSGRRDRRSGRSRACARSRRAAARPRGRSHPAAHVGERPPVVILLLASQHQRDGSPLERLLRERRRLARPALHGPPRRDVLGGVDPDHPHALPLARLEPHDQRVSVDDADDRGGQRARRPRVVEDAAAARDCEGQEDEEGRKRKALEHGPG